MLTIYTKKEYDALLEECCGVNPETITITVRPLAVDTSLFDKKSIHVHIQVSIISKSFDLCTIIIIFIFSSQVPYDIQQHRQPGKKKH